MFSLEVIFSIKLAVFISTFGCTVFPPLPRLSCALPVTLQGFQPILRLQDSRAVARILLSSEGCEVGWVQYGLTFGPSLAPCFHRVAVLRPRLTSHCTVTHCCGILVHAERPPRVKTTTFLPCTRRIYRAHLRIARGFVLSGRLARCAWPYMRFVFLGSGVCLGLPSDSTSRRTPLPSASGWGYHPPQGTFTPKLLPMPGAPG
jgi:hypothetical protein